MFRVLGFAFLLATSTYLQVCPLSVVGDHQPNLTPLFGVYKMQSFLPRDTITCPLEEMFIQLSK